MPWSSQNLSNRLFSNSPPWSLRIWTIPPPLSCLSCRARIRKLSRASDLCRRNLTQVNLEKSSTNTKMYCFPATLSGEIGPIRSIWINSRTRFELIWDTCLCWTLICLPLQHAPHMLSVCSVRAGTPLTTSAFTSLERPLVFMWPSFLCQSSVCDSLAVRHWLDGFHM